MHVINYAAAVKRTEMVTPIFDLVDGWVSEWKLNRDQVLHALSFNVCLCCTFQIVGDVLLAICHLLRLSSVLFGRGFLRVFNRLFLGRNPRCMRRSQTFSTQPASTSKR